MTITKNDEGRRIWDVVIGWGTITSIAEVGNTPLSVEFDNGRKKMYRIDGMEDPRDRHRRLYWREIETVIPNICG